MTTTKSRRRVAGIVSLVAAMALAFASLAGTEAGADPKSGPIAGSFTFRVAPTPGCPDPTCAKVDFRGGIRGKGEGPATAIFPAQPPSNLIGEGLLTVHTPDGDLFLAGTTVFNPDPAGAGETTFLFKITGGTGALAGASGYVMAAGNAEMPGTLIRHVRYTGELILP